ncbi:hypothetical protein JCM8097_008411 [Rhodosporidiobolus ruineniae]
MAPSRRQATISTPLPVPSPFFASRSVVEPAQDDQPAPSSDPAPSPAPARDEVSLPAVEAADERRDYEPEEKLVLAFDIGNSFSSVALTHLRWGSAPLARQTRTSSTGQPTTGLSTIRTVLTYPFSSPSLTPVPSRMPSLLAYDHHDRPRSFGAECLLPETKQRAVEEGWVIVKQWKEQTRTGGPAGSTAPASPAGGKNVLKKKSATTSAALGRASSSPALGSRPASSLAPSFSSPSLQLPYASNASLVPSTAASSTEGLLDAVDLRSEIRERRRQSREVEKALLSGWVDGGTGALSGIGGGRTKEKEREKEKKEKLHAGPRLSDIYGDVLKHLIACARAWYSETTPSGEQTFLRLWPTCVLVLAVPSDFSSADTDLIRTGMEKAGLLPEGFQEGRLMFVKESAAVVHFTRRHTPNAERTWLQEGQSFALCDAAEFGVSVVGYTVASLAPRLKLRAYEPLSRLPSGAHSVLTAFRSLLLSRLSKTKFSKSPHFTSHLVEEFRVKVLPKYSGRETGEFRLRVQPEGPGGGGEGKYDAKAEKWIDSGARIREGWMTFSPADVEECFKPSVDAIIIRLSSTLPRGGGKHILLSGGFCESPYLVRRLKETFEPQGIQLVIPDIPTHTAVSTGSLLLYLSELLSRPPRRTRFALGVQSAVDWRSASATTVKGLHERDVFEGSGGGRLVMGRWSQVVPKDSPVDPSHPWRKTFHFRYRLAAQDPTFRVRLFAHDLSTAAMGRDEDGSDGWMTGPTGKLRPAFRPVCEVIADLSSLVAVSKVRGERGQEWVQLEVELLVYPGEESLEATVVWREKGNDVRGPPTRIAADFF